MNDLDETPMRTLKFSHQKHENNYKSTTYKIIYT